MIKKIVGFALLTASIFSARAEEPAPKLLPLDKNPRILFCGDSITGNGGGWVGRGYCFQLEWALKQVYPDSTPTIVALGGSGQGVVSWLGVEKRSQTEEVMLDVKGVGVKANLDQPADVLVVMLGMNDVLAPYVGGSEEELDKWISGYREVVKRLQARVTPKLTALCTVTPYTEDPVSYKNRLLARMNERVRALAKDIGAVVLPTGEACWEVQALGRQLMPEYHITNDYIHPSFIGNQAMAMGMLRGLGEEKGAQLLMQDRIMPDLRKQAGDQPRISYEIAPEPEPDTFRIKTWWTTKPGAGDNVKPTMKVIAPAGWKVTPAESQGTSGNFIVKGNPDQLKTIFKIEGKLGDETRQAEVSLSTPWLVAGGLIQPWKEGNPREFDPVAHRTPLDPIIEKGGDFTAAIDVGKGKTLAWERTYPSINLTGGADPGSVDYAAVANGMTFEGGYAARWIHSDRARPVKLELTMKNLGARVFMTIWLNGRIIYQKDLTSDPQRKELGKAIVDAALQAGENVLVIKSNHITWQWLFSANLRGLEGDDLADLRYDTKPRNNAK